MEINHFNAPSVKRHLVHLMLAKHKHSHSGEKPIQCSICKKAFTTNGNLTAHKQSHSEEKQFQCSLCPKAFITYSSLTLHKSNHNGEKHSNASSVQRHLTHLVI